MNRKLRTHLIFLATFIASLTLAGSATWNERKIHAIVPILLQMVDRSDMVSHVHVTGISRPPHITILGDVGWYATCNVTETLKGTNVPARILINFEFPAGGATPPIDTNREFIVFLRKPLAGSMMNPEVFLPTDQQLCILPYDTNLLNLVKECISIKEKEAEQSAASLPSDP